MTNLSDEKNTAQACLKPLSSPEVSYVACWTEDDGVHSCGCHHLSISSALRCLTPDGRTFIRALDKDKDKGGLRSLTDDELGTFIRESMLRVLTHQRHGGSHGC
jgi:hypothetical protein